MIYENGILETIGITPVIPLRGLLPKTAANLYIKCEGFNPCGSIKDRPALNMIKEAEERGFLKPGGTIIESSSGNLGTALAMVSAARGYKCIIVVDPRTSRQNIAMIKALGAEVEMVTEINPHDGTYQEARILRAKNLSEQTPHAFMPWQYGNPNNPDAHAKTTALEIINDFPDDLNTVVASVSTGGQISGISSGLKKHNANIKTIGVDVIGSVVFGGTKAQTAVTGMGLGWVPENLNEYVIDEAFLVKTIHCFTTARWIAKKTGILLGGSSGASILVAIREALLLGKGKTVLAIAPDRGDKYLDEFYDDEWMSKRYFPVSTVTKTIMDAAAELHPFRYPSRDMFKKIL